MYKLVCLSKTILKDVFEGITNLVVSFACIIQVFILLYNYTEIRDLEWEVQMMLVTTQLLHPKVTVLCHLMSQSNSQSAPAGGRNSSIIISYNVIPSEKMSTWMQQKYSYTQQLADEQVNYLFTKWFISSVLYSLRGSVTKSGWSSTKTLWTNKADHDTPRSASFTATWWPLQSLHTNLWLFSSKQLWPTVGKWNTNMLSDFMS